MATDSGHDVMSRGTLPSAHHTSNSHDIGKLRLKNVTDTFPRLIASSDFNSFEPSANFATYLGDGGESPLSPDGLNFENIGTDGEGVWGPCTATYLDPNFDPVPCLKIPASGMYVLSIEVIWDENNTGDRHVVVTDMGPGPDCNAPGSGHEWISDLRPATSLSTGTDGKDVQLVSALAVLRKNNCLGISVRQTSGVDLNFDVIFSAVMQ